MIHIFRYSLLSVVIAFAFSSVSAQQTATIRGQHKVKKKETIFGISHNYGLTIEELIEANPEMNTPGYELKKGMVLNSRTWLKRLKDKIVEAKERGEAVWITVE